MNERPLYVLKIIIVGEGGVGKTTMIRRLCYRKYLPQKMTIGADLASYDMQIEENNFKLQLWDFAGEKRFRFFLPSYCKGARGAILVFDLTRYSIFKKLNEWYEILRSSAPQGITIVLMGAKRDLLREKGAISLEEILEFQESHNIEGYVETSSKTGENINEAFKLLTKIIIKKIESF